MKYPSWDIVESHLRAGRIIVGIDEVGRGAWAGPVVAAAVILPPRLLLDGVNDSKLLTPLRRRELARLIRRQALAIGLGWVPASEIDTHGLTWAVRQSGLRALEGMGLGDRLQPNTHVVILDGNQNYLKTTHHSETYVKGDATIVPVAAASIVAKVARDNYMTRLAYSLPSYGFEQHKGYGTALHQAGLASFGSTVFHRQRWAPLMKLAGDIHG